MKRVLFDPSFAPQMVAVFVGLVLLAAPVKAATPGMLANSAQQEATQKQPAATPDPANPSPPEPAKQSQPSEQSSKRESDRVYIEDIYPEYCRSYFHRRDWVSLFEYQTGMYRCLYGTDRD